MKGLKKAVQEKLSQRSTDQLKEDAVAAQGETGVVFVLILDELESRLTEKQYEEFENSL